MARHAGLLVPIFSAPSASSWGSGEFHDVPQLAAWLARAGFDRLMVLPIGAMAPGQTSPYSAASSMAIDPIYISPDAVAGFRQADGIDALSFEGQSALARARKQPRVDYTSVRVAKADALRIAFDRFAQQDWAAHTARASALAGYIARERWWLDDYALFQALTRAHDGAAWPTWPAPLAGREPRALDEARRRLAREVLFDQYLQWIAEEQWQDARRAAAALGVSILGDLPFMVERHSADVWAHQRDFLPDATAGAPPDAYSATGQDWGLPVCNWPAMSAGGFGWIHDRARRMAALYDGFRVDHVVGFYRTYVRPSGGDPYFLPDEEGAQLAQGEAILGAFLATGAQVVAEDLGTVPDFVRESLARLGVAGYRVLRWEREWDAPGQPFRDPRDYPSRSIATTGTHDTEPMAAWWRALDDADRTAIVRRLWPDRDPASAPREYDAAVRDDVLRAMYRSGSDDVILPVQDVFGWADRINTPATVGDDNWTWRLPWPVNAWLDIPECIERARFCRRLANDTGRADAGSQM